MDVQGNLLPQTCPIESAIERLESLLVKILLVIDEERRLVGSVTDGDVRRGLLRKISMDSPVSEIMHRDPISAPLELDRARRIALMRSHFVRHMPLLDREGRVVAIETLSELLHPARKENLVVLMAGGLGRRLDPLTDTCPKPLLKVGAKPILETIVENLVAAGFHRFYLAVRYKREMVETHFGDGSRFGADIRYLREDEPLGTVGALRLLPETPTAPLLVMNGDILTKINFDQLLEFHSEHAGHATMCVRPYDVRVPYGVVDIEGHRVARVQEKPVYQFFVNAGIYVLEPSVMKMIPRDGRLDMTTLFERLIERDQTASVFPLREYWIDIGEIEDLEKANSDYPSLFR